MKEQLSEFTYSGTLTRSLLDSTLDFILFCIYFLIFDFKYFFLFKKSYLNWLYVIYYA